MEAKSFFRALAKSPAGIASGLACLAALALCALGGLSAIASIGIALAVLALSCGVALATGLGQRAASGELEREAAEKASSRLAEASEARRRLAAMRLADPLVAAARDLLVLEAGAFIETCSAASTYDPQGVQAILDACELVDAYLTEADKGSIERRFAAPGAGAAASSGVVAPPEAAARASEAIRGAASLVASRRAAASGEASGADRIAIEEELR